MRASFWCFIIAWIRDFDGFPAFIESHIFTYLSICSLSWHLTSDIINDQIEAWPRKCWTDIVIPRCDRVWILNVTNVSKIRLFRSSDDLGHAMGRQGVSEVRGIDFMVWANIFDAVQNRNCLLLHYFTRCKTFSKLVLTRRSWFLTVTFFWRVHSSLQGIVFSLPKKKFFTTCHMFANN